MDKQTKLIAYKFVIFLGVVSFFADMTYESARSINGAYLADLGASAKLVGFVAGFGALMGYGLRIVSGVVADITGRYWAITIVGYLFNILPVPLMALVGQWQIAAVLIICQHFGKALLIPTTDAMLSHAGQNIGEGVAFGLHEALDRGGAMIGPLVIALLLYKDFTYSFAFAVLVGPAVLALLILLCTKCLYPHPRTMERQKTNLEHTGIQKEFWVYLLALAFFCMGFTDFSLMAYHFSKTNILKAAFIPLSYAFAMGCSALSAAIFGYVYDKIGFIMIIFVACIGVLFAPLVFLGDSVLAFLGVIVWSIGIGSNESLLRAAVARMTALNRRASAYGFFNLCYGVSWFLGSFILGILYDIDVYYLVVFAVMCQLLSIPFLIWVMHRIPK